MKEFKYTITDATGIHARPASELVSKAKSFLSDIGVSKGNASADCKKIFGVMSLNAKCGDEVLFTFSGPDEAEACSALENFMKTKL